MPAEIKIWDCDAERAVEIDRNLHAAMRELSLKCTVTLMCEPPLLSRMNMLGRLPALEIGGLYWTHRLDETIPESACRKLLQALQRRGTL